MLEDIKHLIMRLVSAILVNSHAREATVVCKRELLRRTANLERKSKSSNVECASCGSRCCKNTLYDFRKLIIHGQRLMLYLNCLALKVIHLGPLTFAARISVSICPASRFNINCKPQTLRVKPGM